MIEVAPKPDHFDDWAGLLILLREAFGFMEGRIDPPSSLHQLDAAGLARKAKGETLLLARAEGELVGCLFASKRSDQLHLSKIAVLPRCQGQGIARRLIAGAEEIARTAGLSRLTLQTRIELTENHWAFAALGFRKAGETCHPGFTRPTSVTMRKDLA